MTTNQGNEYVGHGRETEQAFARRTANVEAAFFLPYLKPGMRVVDCGCGQGTITAGIAEAVAPGEVVGFDTLDEHLEKARALASERGLANLRFEHGDINDPPLEPASFDAAFIHVVLVYLADPLGALQKVRGLLKPGGVVGIVDTGAPPVLSGPGNEHYPQLLALFEAMVQRVSNNPYTKDSPYMGLQLKRALREAGFSRIETGGFVTKMDLAAIARWVPQFSDSPQVQRILELGLATQAEVEEFASGIVAWATHPDSSGFRPWPYVVGFND